MFTNRLPFPSEDQEGGLEGILGILLLAQDAPADAVDHRPVPAHDGLEDGLVAPGEGSFDELPVGLVSQRFRDHPPREATEEGAQVCRGHTCRLATVPCSPESSSPRAWKVPNFLGRIIF